MGQAANTPGVDDQELAELLLAKLAPPGANHAGHPLGRRGAPLSTRHLEALAQDPQIKATLERLERLGLVKSYSPSYNLAGGLTAYLGEQPESETWAERLLDYLIRWAEGLQARPLALIPELDALLTILEWASTRSRWQEVSRLGRLIDGALVLSRRWGAWERALHRLLNAARATGDLPVEAWVHHHLGVRALRLEDFAGAQSHLERAARIHRQIGDLAGERFSRAQLRLLGKAPPASRRRPLPRPPPHPQPSPAPRPSPSRQALPPPPPRPTWRWSRLARPARPISTRTEIRWCPSR